MPTIKRIEVKNLKLDLKNFRTVVQTSEHKAIHAIVAINPDWFWALVDSLLDDGYHPTENILVLKHGRDSTDLTVKEGNRRVGVRPDS